MRYDIKITRIKDESSNLLGYADVSLGGAFAIKGIKIMNGSNGPFVSMPNYKALKDGQEEFHDICFPTTAEFREEFNNAVMDAFNKSLDLSKEAPDLAEDERPVSRGRSR